MTVKEYREAQKQVRKEYFREANQVETKLTEGRGRYSLFDISGDIDNPAVEIYSPTLEKLFKIESLGSALETANASALTDRFVSQTTKRGINRNPSIIARNIFSAALGTEHINDPDARAAFEDIKNANKGELRMRNTAYAIRDPKTGELINIEWDFVDPKALSPDNQAIYSNANKNYRDESLITRRKAAAVKNREKATFDYLENIPNYSKFKLDITQDPENRDAFLALVKDWNYWKGGQTRGLLIVSDKIPGDNARTIFHLEGKNNSVIEKNLFEWIKKRFTVYSQNPEKKTKIIKAKSYLNAVNDLWDDRVLTRLCKGSDRKKYLLSQFLDSPQLKRIQF